MANPLSALAAEAHKLEADFVAIIHKDVPKVEAKLKTNLAVVEADLLKAVETATPELKTAVQNAVAAMEKAALDAFI